MAQYVWTFWTFLLWSLEFLGVPPFLFGTFLLLCAFIVASFLQKPPLRARIWKENWSIAFVQFLFFPATVAVATFGQLGWDRTFGENYWGLRATEVFLVGSLLMGIYWIWKIKGLRWVAASVVCMQLWVLLGAQFVAGMALTGDWL